MVLQKFCQYRDKFEPRLKRLFAVALRYKRRPEMDTNGFYGDTFSGGWGNFYTARKRAYSPKIHYDMVGLGGNKIVLRKRRVSQVVASFYLYILVQTHW